MNLIFLMFIELCKLHWVASKVYMNPFGVHSFCTRPNVIYTSINLRKMKFIPWIQSGVLDLKKCLNFISFSNFFQLLSSCHFNQTTKESEAIHDNVILMHLYEKGVTLHMEID